MRKILFCLVCLIFINHNANYYRVFAEGSWAQVVTSGCYVYKTPEINNNIKNIICVAENTYYVEIVSKVNETFYKVNYNGYIGGYVLIDEVKKVNGSPVTPYPSDIRLTTYDKNCYLRSTPTKDDNVISIIPSNYNGLTFIGKTYGEQIGDFEDNIWYLVEYLGTIGYIYSSYVANINTIFPNTENLSYQNNDYDTIINPLSNTTAIIIIVALTLPTLIIIYILYRKPKKIKPKKSVTFYEQDERL